VAYAVELYFDAEQTGRITALTEVVYQTCGGADLIGVGFRPHISLAGYEQIDEQALATVLEQLAKRSPPLPIKLDAIGVFPTSQGVVYLAPVVTAQLLLLHADYSAQADATGHLSHPYYRPGAWIPHCTVAHDLAPEQVGEAVRLCLQSRVFGSGRLVETAIIEHRPVRTLARFMFTGAS
jgi:2'-5' RNA ligase